LGIEDEDEEKNENERRIVYTREVLARSGSVFSSGNRACHKWGAPPYFASPKQVHFMADVANRYPENTGGKYYVDNQCIDCDLCRETAPDNFKRNDDGGYSFVYKQPENPDEEARCKEAKEG